ncbi:MAG: TrbC/VirB2 family protein [Nocardioides sp.]
MTLTTSLLPERTPARRRRSLTALVSAQLVLLAATAGPAAAGEIRPDPSPTLPGGLESKMNTLLGFAMGIAVFAAVLGVIIVAILMFVSSRRGSLEDHFGRLGAVLAGCVLLGGASSIVLFLV